ncbi:MAG: exodeoxyribonuclease VII large subunit [Acidobacteriaceae bacterium]|jgi:exodeoxyribonuclease VII large subunit|nr:exodeoxyribonuclease VII large subunit [Acidobacteriaceae bacterium]
MADLFDVLFEEEPEPEPDPAPAAPVAPARANPVAARRVLSVTDLTIQIRDQLEERFYEIWVEGELSNCRVWNATGHLYFTLKDSTSQIRGFMFRSAVRNLKFKPVDGVKVVARGKISVYEPKGEYQLVSEHLEPQGLGALQLAFDQLKQQLQAEGLFAKERKRPLPALPRAIGIVTSLEGAAIRDMINVLGRRHHNTRLVIAPSRVQGEGAAAEVANALRRVACVPGVDVVIVGRGGGSIEDLWAFNEAIVARAIADCPVPVISAVGHESDVTIADFVADVRAPTPSAAAELVIAAHDEFRARIDRLEGRLRSAVRSRIQTLSRRTHLATSRPAFAAFPARLAMRGRRAAELSFTLTHLLRQHLATRERHVGALRRQLETFDIGRRLAGIRTRLVAADGQLRAASRRHTDRTAYRLVQLAGQLESLSPLAVLGRGYAVAWDKSRQHVLRHASTVRIGDDVRITLARGELTCRVTDRTERLDNEEDE